MNEDIYPSNQINVDELVDLLNQHPHLANSIIEMLLKDSLAVKKIFEDPEDISRLRFFTGESDWGERITHKVLTLMDPGNFQRLSHLDDKNHEKFLYYYYPQGIKILEILNQAISNGHASVLSLKNFSLIKNMKRTLFTAIIDEKLRFEPSYIDADMKLALESLKKFVIRISSEFPSLATLCINYIESSNIFSVNNNNQALNLYRLPKELQEEFFLDETNTNGPK